MTIAVMNHRRSGQNTNSLSARARSPSAEQRPRPQHQIADEMRRLALESARINARQLEICIRQGECLMEAADFIRAAGGVEQWLRAHAIELGVAGTSRTTSANLLMLARAGLDTCRSAIAFAGKHPDRVMTDRRHGPDFFVAALRAHNDRTLPLRANLCDWRSPIGKISSGEKSNG